MNDVNTVTYLGGDYYIHPYVEVGVNILAHAPINIVETNKHFGKRGKGIIRKLQHLWAP